MQPTPSPRSINEAPAFFFTTPLDFFAVETDHTPCATCTGRYLPERRSKYARPEGDEGSSLYQVFDPALEASSFSAFAGTGLPSFFIRATVCSTPARSHISKG